MTIRKKPFGTLSTGEDVDIYILDNGSMKVALSTYGATITSIQLPKRNGIFDDIALGFPTLSGYASKHPFFGSTVGRFANRINKAQFSLNGKEYRLSANNGENSLHGGAKGFDKFVWKANEFEDRQGLNVALTMTSPDGDEGYPGSVDISVVFSLTKDNKFYIYYEGESTEDTPFNLTNHTYFNLKGEGIGTILDHELTMACSRYVPVGPDLIPTGELKDVSSTPFDFRKTHAIGERIAEVPGGYDHCYVVDGNQGELNLCASVREPVSGRSMKVSTTQPGVQLYTGNFLSDWKGKRGSVYDKHSGFCLETQHFPDSPNQSQFPSCILKKGDHYRQKALFEFSW